MTQQIETFEKDLRQGVRGSLTQPMVPLLDGTTLYAIEDHRRATSERATPVGQVAHG